MDFVDEMVCSHENKSASCMVLVVGFYTLHKLPLFPSQMIPR